VVGEPVVGKVVVNVIGIEQGDENVDVEQRDAAHCSSRMRALFLVEHLIHRLDGEDASRHARQHGHAVADGVPVLRRQPLACQFGEHTSPIVFCRLAAISLAACSTSSSTSTVVLMASSITHHASDVNGCLPLCTPSPFAVL
jgi:hypothetical protein